MAGCKLGQADLGVSTSTIIGAPARKVKPMTAPKKPSGRSAKLYAREAADNTADSGLGVDCCTGEITNANPQAGADVTCVLDYFSISRLREVFELLDRWDQQGTATASHLRAIGPPDGLDSPANITCDPENVPGRLAPAPHERSTLQSLTSMTAATTPKEVKGVA